MYSKTCDAVGRPVMPDDKLSFDNGVICPVCGRDVNIYYDEIGWHEIIVIDFPEDESEEDHES